MPTKAQPEVEVEEEKSSLPTADIINKRGQSIAAMGLVTREGDKYIVQTPSLRGKNNPYEVSKDGDGNVICSCETFAEGRAQDIGFRCEHILAVRYSVTQSNAVAEAKTGEEPIEILPPLDEEGHMQLTYAQIRNNLLQPTPKNLIRTVNKKGSPPYVNVTDIKDLLDKRAGVWECKNIHVQVVGNQCITSVDVVIHAIDGSYTQSNSGMEDVDHDQFGNTATNSFAQAFRRACEGHGLCRDMWRKIANITPQQAQQQLQQRPNQQQVRQLSQTQPPQQRQAPQESQFPEPEFPTNPVATSLMDLVTAKQLGMIRALARENALDPEDECTRHLSCKTDELSKKAASYFIHYLRNDAGK
jgi:hypothetical protein